MTDIIKDLATENTVNGINIPKRPKIKQGAFQIYTGEGKGKSGGRGKGKGKGRGNKGKGKGRGNKGKGKGKKRWRKER